jgi:predicted membrane-bound spermidine synthase
MSTTTEPSSLKVHTQALIWLILITEGSALMTSELISTKLLAPYYGNSIYLWSSVLCCTLFGIGLGYAIGGKISKKASLFKLVLISMITAISILLLPEICNSIAPKTLHLNLKLGALISSFVLITPTMLLIGTIGPLAVQLLSSMSTAPPGTVVGKAFFRSTLSGVIGTFIFAFYLIPEIGLILSTKTIAASLCLIGSTYLILQIAKLKYEK